LSLLLTDLINPFFVKTINMFEMKNLIILLAVIGLITALAAFKFQPKDPWKVPAKYEVMKNPVAADKKSILAGKELYASYCISCHGKDGKGLGKRADNLVTTPADFTSEALQKRSDGALLYIIYFGHTDMPGFKKRIPGNQDVIEGTFGKTRSPGDLINYLRTFAKK
jgi:mono/diheme cytochrome c family protein